MPWTLWWLQGRLCWLPSRSTNGRLCEVSSQVRCNSSQGAHPLEGRYFPSASRSGLTRAHVEHRKEKGIDVPQFINHFASRLAKAMAGILFHTQHNGVHPRIGSL